MKPKAFIKWCPGEGVMKTFKVIGGRKTTCATCRSGCFEANIGVATGPRRWTECFCILFFLRCAVLIPSIIR